jgi:hypothetical protein
MPNKAFNLGLGATYKFATLNLSFGFLQPNKDRGETRSLDVQVHSYGRKMAIDFFAQFYNGFYIPDGRFAPASESFYVRPDLAVNLLGGSFQYIFNNTKFSYRAAFQQTEWQKKSAGSFLAGVELYIGRFRGDSTIIPSELRETANPETIRKFRFIEFGPNVGYAYTWVYKKFFVTGGAAISLNAGINRYYDQEGGETFVGFSPNSLVRVSTGYNVRNWSINLFYVTAGLHLPKQEEKNVVVNSGNIRMNFVYRIYPTKKVKRALRGIDKVDKKMKD